MVMKFEWWHRPLILVLAAPLWQSRRNRRRCCSVVLISLLLWSGSVAASTSSSSSLPPIQQEVPTPSPDIANEEQPNNYLSSSSFFVVCTVDGSIQLVQAWDGTLISQFPSGPSLVQPSDWMGVRRMVPGLDGRLYVGTSSTRTDGDNQESAFENDDDTILQPLELTVHELLQSPVKTCRFHPETNQEECGIVTATKATSLFAVDAKTGQLSWYQQTTGSGEVISQHHSDHQPFQQGSTTSSNTSPAASSSSAVLLLQREDILVQQLSTTTGQPVWNCTLGTVQALEFGGGSQQEDTHHLSNAQYQQSSLPIETSTPDVLPSVLFDADGNSLTAVTGEGGQVLWKQDFGSVVASVFGLQDHTWKPLTVLEEQNHHGSIHYNALLPTLPADEMPDYSQLLDEQQKFSYWNLLDRFYYQQPQHQQQRVILPDGGFVPAPQSTISPVLHPRFQQYYPYHPQLALPPPTTMLEDPNYVAWSVVLSLALTLTVFLGMLFRFIYVRKKTQWMQVVRQLTAAQQQQHQQGEEGLIHRSHSVPALVAARRRPGGTSSVALLNLTSSPEKDEPVFRPHTFDGAGNNDKNNNPPPLTSTQTVVTNGRSSSTDDENQQQQGVGFLSDGIPLVRYPRYQSEFTEVSALGKGGFGTVFRCRNALDDREYAIKKVLLKYGTRMLSQSEFQTRLQRTLREVKSLALLDHPNIVRYYTAWLEISNGITAKSSGQFGETTDGDYLSATNTKDLHTHADMSFESGEEGPSNTSRSSTASFGRWPSRNSHYRCPPASNVAISKQYEDLGFTFDRGSETHWDRDSSVGMNLEGSSPRSVKKRLSFQSDAHTNPHTKVDLTGGAQNQSKMAAHPEIDESASIDNNATGGDGEATSRSQTLLWDDHVLFIQMQFCSQKTMADFLNNAEARSGPTTNNSSDVDIPYALNLFLQIAQGVQHVHSQGLIHRDLKPTNCFVDETGVVKVGDFGLSRESGDVAGTVNPEEPSATSKNAPTPTNGDITAGVGTRSYASPEQMKGSDYDASTDIYSLGIMLFELCYAMYTGMERTIVFGELRKLVFPESWCSKTKVAFPKLHLLIESMLASNTSDRPSAEEVVQKVQTILEGFTISSLDAKQHDGAILLRVEAKSEDDVLGSTMKLLQKAASPNVVEILQYGLKSGPKTATMEFAISCPAEIAGIGQHIVNKMAEFPEILLIRQLSSSR